MPLRRQGQLRAARRALEAAQPRAGFVRDRRRQPRPAPSRLSGARAARLSGYARHSLSHRGAGHVFRGEARRSRRRDRVRPVLAPSPRRALPRRARAGRDQDRARPPPRRHSRDVFPQPLLRRQDEGDVAQAPVRRRKPYRHPPARLRGGGRPRGVREDPGLPHHSLRPVRFAADAAAKAGEEHARRVGETPSGARGLDVSRALGSRTLAPYGPEALRLRRRARDRKNGGGRRQSLRLNLRGASGGGILPREIVGSAALSAFLPPSTLSRAPALNQTQAPRSIPCVLLKKSKMRHRLGIVGYFVVAVSVALVLALVGRVTAKDWRTASQEPVGLAPDPATTPEAVVQVYAARVIGWRGVFGVHTWIAVKPAAAMDYTVYEIIGWRLRWQDTALVVRHRAPDARWFGSAPELVAERRGAGVDELIARIDKAAHSYPWAGEYTTWPGPNSNTFTAWVLRAVPELEADLPPTAIGKDYSGKNLLGLTFGINPFDPSLKLPLVGRVGPARAFASKADEAAAEKSAL